MTVLVLLVLAKSKIYYLAPAYPALLAGGAVFLESWSALRRRWLRPAFLIIVLITGAALAPVGVPILSIDATDRFVRAITFGAMENIYELTGDLHGEFGWRERVGAVAEVYNGLTPEEQEQAVLFPLGYGTAGAIDYFGDEHGLPRSVSPAMTCYLWARPANLELVIGMGVSQGFMEQVFEDVEVASTTLLENVNPGDKEFVVTIGRRPRLTVDSLWPQLRPW